MKKIFFQAFLFCCLSAFGQKSSKNATVQILYSPGHPANTFIPSLTLGAAFDGHEKGETNLILKPENIKAMRSSGYGPLTYRLRTELANEVWHWNPHGTWSDPENKQGYWTSSDSIGDFISISHSYRLPRRGNTFDQADNDGYSRIDDGNKKTFWKSNPYLDEYYSDSKNEKHPQWVVIDLGKEEYINAIKIKWAQPYATNFTVDFAAPSIYQYFTHFGYYEISDPGLWNPFENSSFINQTGSDAPIRLSDSLTKVRFIRIRMTESSHTALKGSKDVRDSLGFSIEELYVGKLNKNGVFIDFIHHYPDNTKQSKVYVSSTDCWHRAIDINHHTEQAGIDRIYKSGLTNNLPALFPVGVLYDTPDNAFALINYLEKKHYAISGIEMGEEADGQFISPEDYAFLYDQWAKKIIQKYPELKLGGPSLQGIIPDQLGELFSTKKWLSRFYDYLSAHNSEKFFNFLSFEWYPYDDICDSAVQQLSDAPELLDQSLKDIRASSIPKNIPLYISEYGYSAFSGRSEVTIEGALMNADIVGNFLTLGGDKAFLYGLEPSQLEKNDNCSSFGNNMLFGRDDKGNILYKTATYYGLKMLTDFWATQLNTQVEVYPVIYNNPDRNKRISAYALLCTDSTWSILLINKNPFYKCNVSINIFNKENQTESVFNYPSLIYQYSSAQYKWKEDGVNGYPVMDVPPKKVYIYSNTTIELPPYSLTIVRQIPSPIR